MKRPLLWMGFSYLAAALCASSFSTTECLACGMLLLLCAVLSCFSHHEKKKMVCTVLFSATTAFLAVWVALQVQVLPARALAGSTQEVSGRVVRVVSPRSVEIRQKSGVLLALSAKENMNANLGDHLTARASLTLYATGTQNTAMRRRALLVPLRGFVVGTAKVKYPPKGSMRALLSLFRKNVSQRLLEYLPKGEGGILCGMLLGQKYWIPPEIADAYAVAGIAHILAISGYHMALLSAFFAAMLRAVHCPKRLSLLICVALMWLYMALVGFTPSVVRAGVMSTLCLLAQVLWRKADPLTSMAAAGLVLCLPAPLAVLDLGLQFSFAATLGILLCYEKLQTSMLNFFCKKKTLRIASAIIKTLAVTLAATLGSLPVALLGLGQISPYAPLTNVLITPLVPVALLGGLMAMLLLLVPGVCLLALPFMLAAGLAIQGMNKIATLIAALPGARLPAEAGFLKLWLFGVGVLAVAAFWHRSKEKSMVCALLCLITLLVGTFSYQLAMQGRSEITILQTGHGMALVAVKNGHAAVMGEISSKSDVFAVSSVLKRHGIKKLEVFVLSPGKTRRSGAVASFAKAYHIKVAVLPPEDADDERLLQALRTAQIYPFAEMELSLFGTDHIWVERAALLTEFSGTKTYILQPECDILNCIRAWGPCDVAVLPQGKAENLQRLRCKLLIGDGTAALFGIAPQSVVLHSDAPQISYLTKDGAFRLLLQQGSLP